MASSPTLYGKGHQSRESTRRDIRPLAGGVLCLDFINTAENHDGTSGFDYFAPGYVNIVDWFLHAGAMDEVESSRLLRQAAKDPREAAAVRKRVTSLRHALYEIVTSLIAGTQPPDGSLAGFNQEFHLAIANGRFTPDGDRLAWRWNDGNDLDRMLWEVTRSAADLLGSDRISRVRQCAAPTCQWLFVDTSKNGSRRYCSSATCGNATRVRRFRERQAQAA